MQQKLLQSNKNGRTRSENTTEVILHFKPILVSHWIFGGKQSWIENAAIIIMARLSIHENSCQPWVVTSFKLS